MTNRNVKILDVVPDTAEMTSDTVKVEVDGTTFCLEWWGTDSASGMEVYLEDGKTPVPHDHPLSDFLNGEALDEHLERVKDEFYERWRERVQPLIEKIAQDAIAAAQVPATIEED